MRVFWIIVRVILSKWVALLSGGVGLLLTFASRFLGYNPQGTTYLLIILATLLLAALWGLHDQYRTRLTIVIRRILVRRFSGDINDTVLIDISISNRGSPSIVRDWRVHVGNVRGEPTGIFLDSNGDLLTKPLEQGGQRMGQINFRLPMIEYTERTLWELSCSDISGVRYYCRHTGQTLVDR